MAESSNRYILHIPPALLDIMLQQARAELPNECCGLLAGLVESGVGVVSHVFPLVNEAASPTRYQSEPKSMFAAFRAMRTANVDVLCVYHSHPTSPPIPSQLDRDQNMSESIIQVIISLQTNEPEIRAWWLRKDGHDEAFWKTGRSN